MAELLDRVLHHEGFETKPYQDHLGIWTFGHGLTFITEEESKTIVDARITDYLLRIVQTHDWLLRRPKDVTEVLVEMCYQLGWTGCHNFRKMWAALENQEYDSIDIKANFWPQASLQDPRVGGAQARRPSSF